ncbi:hypothetical protein [Acinetobacter sp.]|uniref:hypothetical protein n=1 Tax=Acinetobacter sp. TaxID=472 RepID=UPI0028AD0680|nr:hypothetical protein [Acinetobacter sp.]
MKKRKDIFGRKIDLTREERKSLQRFVSVAITAIRFWRFRDLPIIYSLLNCLTYMFTEFLRLLKKSWELSIVLAIPYFAAKFALYFIHLSQPII